MEEICTGYKTGSVNLGIEEIKAVRISVVTRVLSGFHREVDQNFALLDY